MKIDDFIAICEAKYGNQWQTKLAKELGVNPRTVRRWKAGHQNLPPSICAFLELKKSIT